MENSFNFIFSSLTSLIPTRYVVVGFQSNQIYLIYQYFTKSDCLPALHNWVIRYPLVGLDV